ncbi:hypothetical protein AAMO2058_001742200, partial [Amorphochlora amoebiformis]
MALPSAPGLRKRGRILASITLLVAFLPFFRTERRRDLSTGKRLLKWEIKAFNYYRQIPRFIRKYRNESSPNMTDVELNATLVYNQMRAREQGAKNRGKIKKNKLLPNYKISAFSCFLQDKDMREIAAANVRVRGKNLSTAPSAAECMREMANIWREKNDTFKDMYKKRASKIVMLREQEMNTSLPKVGSPFLIFINDPEVYKTIREKFIKEGVINSTNTVPRRLLLSELTSRWKNLSDDQKAPYREIAKKKKLERIEAIGLRAYTRSLLQTEPSFDLDKAKEMWQTLDMEVKSQFTKLPTEPKPTKEKEKNKENATADPGFIFFLNDHRVYDDVTRKEGPASIFSTLAEKMKKCWTKLSDQRRNVWRSQRDVIAEKIFLSNPEVQAEARDILPFTRRKYLLRYLHVKWRQQGNDTKERYRTEAT